MHHYYRKDNSSNPILESNFTSSTPLTDPDLIEFTVGTNTAGNIYYVIKDDNGLPITNTLSYGEAECERVCEVMIEDACSEFENIREVYFGTESSLTILNSTQIEAGNFQSHLLGKDITIEFNTSSPIYHWVAWSKDDNTISGHFINDLDHSSFGATETFCTPVLIGDYLFVINNFATQIPFVTLKH